MSGARTPVEPTPGVLVHTRRERELAVSHWLLSAAQDMKQAREEWATSGIALLRCGGIFSAVRIPAELVHAAAGTQDLRDVDHYLAEASQGGPVFIDTTSKRYYALVPASAARQPLWDAREVPDAECLGPGSYLGVPTPEQTTPDGARSYWCVPMDGPGALCSLGAVSQLVTYGRHRRVAAEREADG